MAQMVFSGVRWLPLSMVFSIALAAGTSYFYAIITKQVPGFIPFIRHSAAYPPQSGIFSIFIAIGAFLGTLTFLMRYVVVKHREFQVEHKRYQRLNQASMFMGLILNICLIYTSNNPLGFQTTTKYRWIVDVLVPHHVGALSLCLCFNIYVLIQAYITYQQKRVFKKNVFTHAVLATCAVVSTWTAVIPLSPSLKDEVKSLTEDENQLVNFEYKEYSFYSTICALSEWSFIFFSLLFILSFFQEFGKVNIRLQVKPKRVSRSNTVELPTLSHQDDKETTKI